jgi:hypothetical protein
MFNSETSMLVFGDSHIISIPFFEMLLAGKKPDEPAFWEIKG